MKASELLLNAARNMGQVIDGSATADGSTTTLIDALLAVGMQPGACLFLTSGDNAGAMRKVKSVLGNVITMTAALTTATESGDGYAIAGVDYDMLQNAARSAFGSSRYMEVDETLVVVEDQEFYTLPTGVGDVRRIEIGANTTAPYGYMEHHYWEVVDGKIQFYNWRPLTSGQTIRLHYAAQWSYNASGDLPEAMARYHNHYAWMTIQNYWREYTRYHKNDDPLAVQLMNEASAMLMRYPKPRLDLISRKFA